MTVERIAVRYLDDLIADETFEDRPVLQALRMASRRLSSSGRLP